MWVLFALGAQSFDVHVERPRIPEVIGPPNAIDKRLARQDAARVLQEEFEQLELFARKMDLIAAHCDLETIWIEPHASALEDSVGTGGLVGTSAKNSLDARQELA